MRSGAAKYDQRLVTRITSEMLTALQADAETFGRDVAQSARFAIDFYLASTPPPTAAGRTEKGDGKNG